MAKGKDIVLTKTMNGLVPGDSDTDEWYHRIKLGESVWGKEFTRMRNVKFHRKFFALITLAYNQWEPPAIDSKWGKVMKNKKVFRKHLLVLAGYGEPVFKIDGSFRMEAKSIAFSNMDQEEFEKVYNSIIDVILEQIPQFKNYTRDEMDELVNKVLHFA